jgi:hypothetical protein
MPSKKVSPPSRPPESELKRKKVGGRILFLYESTRLRVAVRRSLAGTVLIETPKRLIVIRASVLLILTAILGASSSHPVIQFFSESARKYLALGH